MAELCADKIPATAVGIQLFRITKGEDLIACEPVVFLKGRVGVSIVLRRASISGRVEVGGDISDYFADLHDEDGDIVETVSLDRNTYAMLKNHWMRCKVQREDWL